VVATVVMAHSDFNTSIATKVGIPWDGNGRVGAWSQAHVSWYYTWSPSPIDSNLEFVPMLWGTAQLQQFSSTINATIAQNLVTAVLAFNEPEQPGQSNLTPSEGAQLWAQYIEPLKAQGVRLGTPAPSSAPSGKTWLQDWLAACNGSCNPDFLAVHWYDVNATAFEAYLIDYHNTFNLPVWVTEWACQNYNPGPQCTQQGVVDLLNQTQAFMDATSWVERYAWFGVMENLQGVNPDNAMMTSTGAINALGEQYIGEQAAPPLQGGAPGSGCLGAVAIRPRDLLLVYSAISLLAYCV